MPGIELRPLSLGELLDKVFVLYRRNFALFAGIMVIPSCLMIPERFLYLRTSGGTLFWSRHVPQPHHNIYFFVGVAMSWIFYGIAQAAITYASADAYLGRTTTVGESYRRLMGRIWRIVGLTFSVGLRIWGIALLAILPLAIGGGILIETGVKGGLRARQIDLTVLVLAIFPFFVLLLLWVSLRYAISLPSLLLEDLASSAAIRRSIQLTEGRRAQIFVGSLLGIVVSYAMATLVEGPFYAGIAIAQIKGNLPDWLALMMSIATSLGRTVASPVLTIIVVLFYFDLRVRKEGFDLQHMMSSFPPNRADSIAPSSA